MTDTCNRNCPRRPDGDWVDWDSLTPQGADGGHRVLLTGETLRRAQAGYYGLIEHLDHEIAPLIDDFTSRSAKAGRPWVIVFTSDHGEMMGDHGYFRKCEPFEGSANIPMIIAGSPELKFRAGERCGQPVCLEDLLPTLVELACTACPTVDGVSLVPVLRGEAREIRPWLHFEHAPCYSKQQAFHALTDGRFKYVWRPHDGTERLFDLDMDPREEHDLSVGRGQPRPAGAMARTTGPTIGRPARRILRRNSIDSRPPLSAGASERVTISERRSCG